MSLNNIKNKIYRLLKTSERYTKTDMVYLAKGGFWLTTEQVVSFASAFLLSIALANFLSQEAYGVYKYVLSITGFFIIFSLPEIKTSLIRSIANGCEGSFLLTLKAKAKWSVLSWLGFLAIAAYYFTKSNNILAIAFLIAGMFSPLLNILDSCGSFLKGRKDFKRIAKFSIFYQISHVASLIFITWLTENIFLILLFYFLPTLLVRIILLKTIFFKLKPNKKIDKETVPYGKYLSFIALLGFLAKEMDKILAWHFLGPINLAIYGFATAPVEHLKNGLNTVKNLAQPKLSQRNLSELKEHLPKKITRFFLLVIPVFFIYYFICPYFFKTFYPKYLDSIIYSQLFAVSILLIPHSLLMSALSAHKRKKEITFIRITMPLIKIALFLIFLPLYGLLGLILSQIIGGVFDLIISSFLFKKSSS